jgi:hypothetical protein
MLSESERLQSELEPLELVKPAPAEGEVEWEPGDAAAFAEVVSMREALEGRCDRIMQSELSPRVKQARLNLTRKEIAALKYLLDGMIKKYEAKSNG